MKMLWKLTKEAARYKGLYILAILSTLALTILNLSAPKILSSMTGVVEKGVDDAALTVISRLALMLLVLYLLRILFRFLNNYLAHKAAWYLVKNQQQCHDFCNTGRTFSCGCVLFKNNLSGGCLNQNGRICRNIHLCNDRNVN